MSGSTVVLLTDPTYAIPLVVTFAAGVALLVWSRRRREPTPPVAEVTSRRPWATHPDAVAYLSIQRGQYLPAIDLLGRRLSTVLVERYHLKLDRRRALRDVEGAGGPDLPSPLTLPRLLRHLLRAYQSAYLAESVYLPPFDGPWFAARRRRRAARDFSRTVRELEVALPILEAR